MKRKCPSCNAVTGLHANPDWKGESWVCGSNATTDGLISESWECRSRQMEALKAENDRLQQWVNDLQSGMYINCVYCGHRYGPKEDTPVSMADVLRKHIEQCPEHPCSKLKDENDLLKADYYELIMSVGMKWPGETRHQTALRYICEAERCDDNQTAQAESEISDG